MGKETKTAPPETFGFSKELLDKVWEGLPKEYQDYLHRLCKFFVNCSRDFCRYADDYDLTGKEANHLVEYFGNHVFPDAIPYDYPSEPERLTMDQYRQVWEGLPEEYREKIKSTFRDVYHNHHWSPWTCGLIYIAPTLFGDFTLREGIHWEAQDLPYDCCNFPAELTDKVWAGLPEEYRQYVHRLYQYYSECETRCMMGKDPDPDSCSSDYNLLAEFVLEYFGKSAFPDSWTADFCVRPEIPSYELRNQVWNGLPEEYRQKVRDGYQLWISEPCDPGPVIWYQASKLFGFYNAMGGVPLAPIPLWLAIANADIYFKDFL